MSSWKAAQSKKQIAKKTKLALLVLGVVVILVLLAQAAKFTKTLFTPWRVNPATQRNFFWNADFNLNILVRSFGISLVSFSSEQQKVTIIDIPDSTFPEVAHGFGKWQISSVYELGRSQGLWGGDLLKDTITYFFGLPIEGFLDFSADYSRQSPAQLIDSIRKNPLALYSSLPYLKTDLTPFELMRLQMGLSKVRFDKIKHANLEKLIVLDKDKLPDGTLVYTVDPLRLDGVLSDMVDPILAKEKKTIAIFNCTDHQQLAQKAARLITNIGGNVIIVSNGQKKFKTSKIVGEKSKTLERLAQIFDGDGKIDPKDDDLISSRAQINLFLGEDYFKKL